MNGNPDSLPARQVVYQVIATRVSEDEGQALRARLGSKPFLIGSGKSANMLLDNAEILPVQIRLLASTSGQVLLTNLGDDENVRMNGEPLPTLVPTYWKPGLIVSLADFELQLVTLVDEEGDGHLERVRPAVITQASEIAPERSAESNFVIEWGDSRDLSGTPPEIPANNTVMFDKNAPVADEDEAEDTREGWKLESPLPEIIAEPPPPPPPSLTDLPVPLPPIPLQAVPRLDDGESTPTESMPPGMKLPQLDEADGFSPPTEQTLPKNWQSAGKLSAQLTNDSINLVIGERVRIPLSVRNDSANPIQLRIHVAGLPKDWTAAPDAPATLAPADIKSVDVILETLPPFDQAYLDALLHIHDQLAPDTYLTLPLRLNFKTTPNIVGRLSPTRLATSQTAYLNLHNHTQVTITTFIAGHSEASDLHVIPAQAQIELPPGQSVEIPVSLRPMSRPWLRGTQRHFAVSARHSNRAALDYPGIARVRPRISSMSLLLFAAVVLALFVAWRMFGNNSSAGVLPAATSTSRLPAVAEQTEISTQEADASAEVRVIASPRKTASPRPSLSPTPTLRPTSTSLPPTSTVAVTDILPTPIPTNAPAAITDPRPAGCTTPIPDGWKPYTVQAGDRVFRLAMTYGTTIEEVANVNCLSDPRMLQIRQVLLLPIP